MTLERQTTRLAPPGETQSWHSGLPASPFPMWVFDPRTGAILAANDAALGAYGYARAELLACYAQDLCQLPDPNQCFATTLERRSSPWAGAVMQRRRDGASFDADMGMIETEDAAHVAVMVIVNPIPMRTEPELNVAIGAGDRPHG